MSGVGCHVITYSTRVDGNTVVLVVNGGVLCNFTSGQIYDHNSSFSQGSTHTDQDCVRGANVKSISVLSERIAGRGVNGDVGKLEVGSAVDAEDLDRGVENGEGLDERVSQVVGLEELGLGDTTAATLTIPVGGAVAVEDGVTVRGTGNLDVGSADGEQRAFPLGVLEGGLALKDDGGVIGQVGQVQGDAAGHGQGVQDDGGA